MKRLITTLSLLISAMTITAAGAVIVPRAIAVIQLRQASDDPVALTELRLKDAITREVVGREIDAAIAAEDSELAESFITLAEAHGLTPDPAWRASIEALRQTETRRALRDLGQGFISGGTDSMAGMAGGFAADMIGYGDMRDLYQEGSKLALGEAYDEVVLGMAAVGLAVTVATVGSFGGTAPARGGLTALKTAKKAGRLSKPLVTTLSATVREVVDEDAVKGAVSAARRLDLNGTKLAALAAVRSGTVAKLRSVAENATTLFARTGPRGTMQALSIAENVEDVRRASRLATAFGPKTRAALKLLGKGALVLGAAFAEILSWVWAGIAWGFAVMIFARKIGVAIGYLISSRQNRLVRAAMHQ
jgi:hypothetical protein